MTGMIRNTGFFAIFLQTAIKAVCCHNLAVGFKDIYIKFLDATPVGMLPSISGISDTPEYKENETVQKFSNAVDVISDAMDKGTAIGYEHGPSVQAGLLTSQGIIESMFQDIITNGTDVKKAAKKAENQLNDLFSTVQ